MKLGAEISLFLDESERPGEGVDLMDQLTPNLRSNAEASAILAVLMSPPYLRSAWCKQELDWWLKSQHACILAFAHHARIAVARILPTETSEWPPALLDEAGKPYVGVQFFQKTTEPGLRPFGWSSKTNEEFDDAVTKMAGVILMRLRAIRNDLEVKRVRKEKKLTVERIGRAGDLFTRASQSARELGPR
jgi:hypothetical protein